MEHIIKKKHQDSFNDETKYHIASIVSVILLTLAAVAWVVVRLQLNIYLFIVAILALAIMFGNTAINAYIRWKKHR